MNQLNRTLMIAVGVLLGAGCVQETAPTVEYFRAHQTEREAQIARCANDPGSLKDSPACINAQQAAELEQKRSLRDLPSMGLQEQTAPRPADDAVADKVQ